MDPYQLFSTPPADQMLSSTPLKQRAPKTLNPAKTKTPSPPKKSGNTSGRLNKSLCTPTAIKKRQNKNKNKRQAKKENVWEKHLKNNPELAQFVDQFNHSLEEATSKPLDMS